MPKTALIDITGKKFGRLTVVGFLPNDSKYSRFVCLCDCGKIKHILGQSLRNGATQSCGCLHREAMRARGTHRQGGSKRTGAYSSWANMMMRCEWVNSKHPSYAQYGAVGIRVDPSWHKFENFYEDMGDRPAGMSVDRINNDGGYSRDNCRWASTRTQALNRRDTLKAIYNGVETSVYELCNQLDISHKALGSRAKRRGGDYEAAFKSIGFDVKVSSQKRAVRIRQEHGAKT